MSHHIESPMPLSDIESVLAWVDTFKLSRVTKKINRDFSDAVLLAEILNVHYPKLVEMHNYPPRNSHSLKLNNWMTLNRKVLKKLKLGLCCNTMEQLADSAPGVIERVLVMVREKIRRDEEANKSLREEGTNMSSGGSYYEAGGDEDHILVVPVKTRVNGVLETIQQKVVNYESFCALKLELKDAIDAAEVLKQKVEHLDSLLKLKEERIDELQNQLERKQARRKEIETQQNTLSVPYDNAALTPHAPNDGYFIPAIRTPSLKTVSSKINFDEANIKIDETKIKLEDSITNVDSKTRIDESRIPLPKESLRTISRPSLTDVQDKIDTNITNKSSNIKVENIKSEVFRDVEFFEEKYGIKSDNDDFRDSEQGCVIIEGTLQKEIKSVIAPNELAQDFNTYPMK